METVWTLFELYKTYALKTLGFLWDPTSRVYSLYLISSLLFAFIIYKMGKWQISGKNDAEVNSFTEFLFPKHVWKNPTAWLDVRYFFFHKLLGHFLLFGAAANFFTLGYAVTGADLDAILNDPQQTTLQQSDFFIVAVFMFIYYLSSDFFAYWLHYLQHKIPVLWEFHKVHHSAEVMHPLSNFREHPIDNLFYNTIIGFGGGMVMGITSIVLGYLPSLPVILGLPIFMFLFNLVGYNLRHSHIWFKWPGVWSKVFPSSAHHHVHHSCHEDHLDKNFAFMFPVWDVIFGTYVMPEDSKDVRFGVLDPTSKDMDTCVKLYTIPFKKAWKHLKAKPTA